MISSYKKLCTEFYDLDKPDPPQIALEYYWRRHRAAASGPTLEVMCGSGRFLLPFAERGADIDGVDASFDMLGSCQRKLDAQDLTSKLYLQLLQDLDLPRRYGFAFVPAGSFVLIPQQEQQASLDRLAHHLLPDAELIIDMPTPGHDIASRKGRPPERRVTRSDGSEIVLSVEADGTHRYDDLRDGSVVVSESERYDWAPRNSHEFGLMLSQAGFSDIRSLTRYSGNPASDSDETILYVCRRTAASL
jgi:SAM-dependent methyltransferase